MNTHRMLAAGAALAAALTLAACASVPDKVTLDTLARQVARQSFRDEGQAKVDRLEQDDANRYCSEADTQGRSLPDEYARAIEAANLKAVKLPSDGKFLGDWRQGEQIAQSGRGMTWTDNPAAGNGGNCYNCHQLSKEEISYGTIGPSLYQYAKLRGIRNPEDAAARPIVEYTWGKIWNARAYNACSNMPRFGHAGIIGEQQIRHLMSLLLDPASPVNQ